jgi:HlyD family secretion protein
MALTMALTMTLALGMTTGCGKGGGGGLDGVIELEQRALGFELGGRVATLAVSRGDRVHKDQPLAKLDDSLERAQGPLREAELAGAEARLALLMAGARASEVRALEAQLTAASTQVEAAERDLARQQGLFARGASTRAMTDDLETRLQRARAERDAAAQRLRTVQGGSRPQEIRAAEAARDGARAALALLHERLQHYQLLGPAEGVVLDVTVREGEVVSPGAAVVLFAQPGTPYVDVFVPTPALAGLQVGQAASVRPDGEARSYPARIEHISRVTEYTPRYLLSEAERATLVTRVRVRIEDKEERLHAGVPCKVTLAGKGGQRP